MNLQLNCPFCQMLLSVDARFAGGQMQCPSCQQVFMVGGSAPAIPVAQPIAASQPAPQRPAAPQAPRPGVPGPPRGGAAPKSYAPVPASSGGGLKIVLGVVGLVVVGGLIYGTMQFLDSAKKKSSAGMELSPEAKAREAERLKAIRQLKEDQIAEKKEVENLIKEWIAARIGDTDKRAAEELTRECNSIIQELDKLYADADSNNDPKDLRAFWVERLGKRIEENKIIYHWLGGRPVASLL